MSLRGEWGGTTPRRRWSRWRSTTGCPGNASARSRPRRCASSSTRRGRPGCGPTCPRRSPRPNPHGRPPAVHTTPQAPPPAPPVTHPPRRARPRDAAAPPAPPRLPPWPRPPWPEVGVGILWLGSQRHTGWDIQRRLGAGLHSLGPEVLTFNHDGNAWTLRPDTVYQALAFPDVFRVRLHVPCGRQERGLAPRNLRPLGQRACQPVLS